MPGSFIVQATKHQQIRAGNSEKIIRKLSVERKKVADLQQATSP